MDIKYHIEMAWKYCINNLVQLIILTAAMSAVSFFSFGILAPVAAAGYMHALFQLLKFNRAPKAGDIFSQLHLFFPLLLFSIVILIITFTGFTLMVLPGILFSIIISYTGLYVIPIMVDKQYGILDAIKKSISMVTHSRRTDHIFVFVIFTALSIVGGASFLGFFFIQPFATLFLLSAYEQAY